MVNHRMVAVAEALGPFPAGGVKCNCESCPAGDMHSNYAVRESLRTDFGGQNAEISMDIGGPMPIKSARGNRWPNAIRDRHGRYIAIYFFPTKDQVLPSVKQYLVDTKKLAKDLGTISFNPNMIVTDDDMLYVSKEFTAWTRDNNI